MATMMQLSEVAPSELNNGKVWLKPSIAQASMYINGQFRPFAGGDYLFTYTVPLTVFIRGIDRTAFTKIYSFEKTDYIYEKVDQLVFILDDKDNVVDITEGEEVIVFRKETESSTPTIWFAGFIEDVKPVEYYSGAKKFVYNVSCVDYTKWLDKTLAVKEYENKSAYEIIADLVEDYATDFYIPEDLGTPYVDKIKFNYKSIGECLKQIADLVNYFWYIDYEKTIHFFTLSTEYAPYTLTDSLATTGHYKNLTINVNKSQLRNRVYVRGGTYLSPIFTEEFVADGIQTTFKLAYKPRNPVEVYVDIGSGYVQKTLGVDSQSTTADFVVNYTNQTIKNMVAPTLNAGDKIKITYKYEIQVLTQDDDLVSQEMMRMIEGGSGVYSFLITDTTILSIDTAHSRAGAELIANSYPIIEGSFVTDQEGFRSGQTLLLQMPSWGYDGYEVIIQKVISRLQNCNNFFYDVRFATRKKTLTEFLAQMHESILMMPQSWAVLEEETLNDLMNADEDSMQFGTEGTPTFEERNPSTNPYKWGTDADDFYWNEGQWEA